MSRLIIDPFIREKLAKRRISEEDIRECFSDLTTRTLIDDREEHKTDPPSRWFIARTDKGRQLKVVFMHFKNNNEIVIKTAFEPTKGQIELYREKMTLL